MHTYAQDISDWVTGLSASAIPASEMYLARARIADTLGLIAAGKSTAAACAGAEIACTNTGVSSASRWPPLWRAFVHGLTAHCRDFDDTFPQSVVHPGSTIVSSAMALGASLNASDDEILTAIVAGYEIGARLGLAGGRNLLQRGYHGTGVYGPIIAAITAGKLLRLDAQQLTSAIGLSTSMSSGLFEFQTDASWSKWLHVGWSCLGGIMAAQLAKARFVGPATGLEGHRGLYAAFMGLDKADLPQLNRHLGAEWLGRTALPKYFPCAHVIQPFLHQCLMIQNEIDARQIAQVTCEIGSWAVALVCEPLKHKQRPRSDMDAIGALPYLVAAALIDPQITIAHLEESNRNRADILDLSDKVAYRANPGLSHSFDGSLEFLLKDGTRILRQVSELAVDEQAIAGKARRLLGARMAQREADVLVDDLLGAGDIAKTWGRGLALIGEEAGADHG